MTIQDPHIVIYVNLNDLLNLILMIQLTPKLFYTSEFIILALPSLPISDPKIAKTFEFFKDGSLRS